MVPVSCPHCDGHGTLIAAYRGAVNLLLAEQRKYLQACADWYRLKHAAQPAPQPLTEAQIIDLIPTTGQLPRRDALWLARAIERAHGITAAPTTGE